MKLEVQKVYQINIIPESDDYCEVIHNHIEQCPVCKTKFASTDQYCDLNEDQIEIIQCDECDSYFKLVDGNWYGSFNENELEDYMKSDNYLYPKVIVVDKPIKVEVDPIPDPLVEAANKKREEAFTGTALRV